MSLNDHLEKLKYFSSIATFGSFSQASKQLGISQPSLTHAVNTLEQALDCPLFVRTNNGVIITEQGQILLEFANRLSEQGQQTESRIRSADTNLDIQLTIGTHESISIYLFPFFFRYLSAAQPNLNISLRTGRSHTVIELLKNKEVDLSISINPLKSREIVSQTLYVDHFNFFIQPSIARSFENLPVILMSQASATAEDNLEKIVRRKLKSKVKILRCENHETVKAFAEQGVGVGVLPDLVARASVSKGLLLKLASNRYSTNLAPHDISISCLAKRSSEKQLLTVKGEIIRFVDTWLTR